MAGLILLAVYGVLLAKIYSASAHPHLWILAAQAVLLLPLYYFYIRRDSGWNLRILLEPRVYYAVYIVSALGIGWVRGAEAAIPADEAAWSFQARIFASGHLSTRAIPETDPDPAVACGERFFEYHIIQNGRWFTLYPPGWPLVLALGLRAHLAWLMNPLLGLLLLWMTARLARVWGNGAEESGTPALMLAALSPFYVLNSVGYLSHALCAVFVTGAVLAFFDSRVPGATWRFAQMYAFVGAAALVRPATGFALGLVLTGASLYEFRRDKNRIAWVLGSAVGLGAVTFGLYGVYNLRTSGGFLTSGYQLFAQKYCFDHLSLTLGGLMRTGVLTLARWSVQSTLVFTVPFLVVLAGYALWNERSRESWVLAGLIVLLGAIYLPINAPSSSSWGERYYFESFPALCALGARGLWLMKWPATRMAHIAALTVAVQVLQCAVLVPPVLHRLQPTQQIRELVASLGPHRVVVFLDTTTMVAKHANLNQADWWNAEALYLPDPGRERRGAVTTAVGRSQYVLLGLQDNRPWLSPLETPGTAGEPPGGALSEARCNCTSRGPVGNKD